MAEPLLLLTVDVEPDWGVGGDRCVRSQLPRLLDLLDRHGVSATFFIVAGMLDTCAELFGQVAERHEIASHGLTHRRLTDLDARTVETELRDSMARLETLGAPVRGFRSPFLMTPAGWASRLRRAGYAYDSSTGRCYPSLANTPRGAWRANYREGVWTLPTATLGDGVTPFSLTWLRLPTPFGAGRERGRGPVLYLHLHELAPPALADALPRPMRWLLRRNAGERAWGILERIIRTRRNEMMTCWQYVRTHCEKGKP